MLTQQNSLSLAHAFISQNVKAGDICIDATAGRGRDTAFLCSLVGEEGHVYAFDIQNEAIESTKELLSKKKLSDRASLILDSHSRMDRYVKQGVSCVVFNFGYLPAGDHKIFTKPQSSIEAIEKSLALLKPGGIVSLCIYYGGDSGFEEKDALLDYLKKLDSKKQTVLLQDFYNRPNCPPIVVNIQKAGCETSD